MHLTRATVTKLKTDDGLVETWDYVKVGDRYVVDLDTVRADQQMYNLDTHVNHRKTIVQVQNPDGTWGWMALELLKVDTDG